MTAGDAVTRWREKLDQGATVNVACCPEHGLHGTRQACFECGGPVEHLELVGADCHRQAGRELDRVICQLSNDHEKLVAALREVIAHPRLGAQIAREALNDHLDSLSPTSTAAAPDLGTLG